MPPNPVVLKGSFLFLNSPNRFSRDKNSNYFNYENLRKSRRDG